MESSTVDSLSSRGINLISRFPPGEGGGMGPRIMFQDATDVDQSLPTSGTSTPGLEIGDTGDENQPTGEPSRSPRMAPIFTQISLSLPSAESTNDIAREIGCTDSLLRSMREYVDTVGSRLSSTSREGSPRGHIACRRRERHRKEVWLSQSHSGGHPSPLYQSRGSFKTLRSSFPFDGYTRRRPSL